MTVSDPLDDGAGGQRAAAAHGDEGQVASRALELVEGGGDQAGAGGADRVAEGDGAAVDVDLVPVDVVDLAPAT